MQGEDSTFYTAPQGSGITTTRGLIGLSPVIVFLAMYLVVSVIAGDFYKMPISIALTVASAWAVAIYRGHPLTERIEVFSRAAGHSNIMFMLWIFVLAGSFASLAKQTGAVDATVSLTLQVLPAQFIAPGLFLAACFISISIGTSVGTVVALAPLASQLALSAGGNVAFFVAVVLGGAFFGDNLSFISDTTIAATRTQRCSMSDKFRANLWIAVPAALVTLVLYGIMSRSVPDIAPQHCDRPWLVVPYLAVIVMAVAGINVTTVLACGTVAAFLLGAVSGYGTLEMFGFMGEGVDSMGNLIIITLLAAGMLGMVKAAGGISYLLQIISRRLHGARGAQACISVMVGLVNLCTANNTVAIITVGSMAREISGRFGIDPRKSASLLDTSSCIVQCLIPYGAQTLLATALAGISPADPFRYMYYPLILAIMVAFSIIFRFPRK